MTLPEITARRGGIRYDDPPWVGCTEPTIDFVLAEEISHRATFTVRELGELLIGQPIPEQRLRRLLEDIEINVAELDTMNDGELIRATRERDPGRVGIRRYRFDQ